MLGLRTAARSLPAAGFAPRMGNVVMALILGALGFYVLYPIVLILINSFNVAELASDPPVYSLANWRHAFGDTLIFDAVKNTFLIYVLYTSVSFPAAVLIAWVLGRTNIPGAQWLEFGFWVSYLLPSLTTTIGWILMLHPQIGLLNDVLLSEVIPRAHRAGVAPADLGPAVVHVTVVGVEVLDADPLVRSVALAGRGRGVAAGGGL